MADASALTQNTTGALTSVNPTLTSSQPILGALPTGNTTTSSVAAPSTGQTAGGAGATAIQGGTNPLVTSTATNVTGTPSWYTDFLNQISTQGQNAAQNAQYVGATDLQNQAFNQVAQNVGNYEPDLTSAENYISQVGNSNLAQAVGDVGQANIARNLAPQATAGLVGSGQFGSSRGATALGDTIANAELGLTQAQAQALQTDMANKLAAGQAMGNLATTTAGLGTQDVNNLATLGAQEQTIAQNAQLFPMQQLANESTLLKNYSIPTSTSTSTTAPATSGQMGLSNLANILSLAGSAGTALGGSNGALSNYLFGTPASTDKNGNPIPATSGALSSIFSNIFGNNTSSTSSNDNTNSNLNSPVSMDNINAITLPNGDTATPNGDGTYNMTNFDGSISVVNSDGNPV
jgi:hypothetical protein